MKVSVCGAAPAGDPSHRLQHASDNPLTSSSVLSSLASFLLAFHQAARNETQKGAACFSDPGIMLMSWRWLW